MVDKMEGGQTNKLKFNVTGMGKKNKNGGAPSSPNKKFKKDKNAGKKFVSSLKIIRNSIF